MPARPKLRQDYLRAIELEMAYYASFARLLHGLRVATLFIGGGTPTLYDRQELSFLLRAIHHHFQISAEAEISIEANPETITAPKLELLRSLGVNRLSIGVQSFDDLLLSHIGRQHTAAQGLAAVQTAKDVGFTNVNLDLMFGLPGQTIQQHRESLQQALALGLEHLSVYGLQLEEGTHLEELVSCGELQLPDDDEVAEMYLLTDQLLTAAGYRHYEVSNYALEGKECRHHLDLWQNQEYIGLGAGAFSYIEQKRFANVSEVSKYCHQLIDTGCPPLGVCEEISAADEVIETLMLAFRTQSGLELSNFAARHGFAFRERYGHIAQELLQEGLLLQEGDRLTVTLQGMLLNNRVTGAFI